MNSLLAIFEWSTLLEYWPHMLGGALATGLSLGSSAHAVLNKRDTRAAIAWVGVIWLAPVLGSLLYGWLGINRIRRRARHLRRDQLTSVRALAGKPSGEPSIETILGPQSAHLHELVRMAGALTKRPLLEGNKVEPLVGADEAYPAMLSAIGEAQQSVTLASYIFNNDPTGQQFVAALAAAVKRGVDVRVLIDDIGARYTWPSILRSLRRAGVPVALFLPALVPVWSAYSNLRSHRKILVVDGRTGFTGGMNIRQSAEGNGNGKHLLEDIHFRFQGPVVAHLQQVFADDWEFTTGEPLTGASWFPPLEPQGPVAARGISDGPDEDFDKLRLMLLGAIACAQSSIRIVTPYFLPDSSLITSLDVAVMRGVQVDILLPEQNNLSLVQWASTALLWQLLSYDCRVWLTPPPFDHTKLMLVDDAWALVGSGNWDPRSLRLNFEFNVECYDRALTGRLSEIVQEKIARSRRVTLAEVDGRPLPIKLRDGIARLFSPYL